jgi:phage gp29-like protein
MPLSAIAKFARRIASALFAERPAPRSYLREIDTPRRRLGPAAWNDLVDNPDEILARHSAGRGLELYREMVENDSTIAAAVGFRKNAVLARPRRIDDNGAPPEIAAFVRAALEGIEDLDGDLGEMLDAVPFGLSVSEAIFEQRPALGAAAAGSAALGAAGAGRALLWPVRLKARNPADYVFDADGNLRLLTAEHPVEGEPVPPAPKFVAVAFEPRHENPYGTPALRCLYRPYYLKKNAAKFWAIALEKTGMPFLLARLKQRLTDDEIARLESMLAGFQTESYGWVYSDDVEDVRFLEPARTFGREVYLPFLEYWDRRIFVRYLGSHLANEMSGEGSRAAAEAHAEVSEQIVRADAAWLSQRFSKHFLEPLVRVNFEYAGPCPRLVMG